MTNSRGVTVCVGLSLILLVCLASAYFAKKKVEPLCDMAEGGGKEQDCDSHFAYSDPADDESMKRTDKSKQRHEDMPAIHKKEQSTTEKLKSVFVRPKSKEKPGTKPDGLDSEAQLYVASMVLSGVGDAMGYYNGKWEFNYDGPSIHQDLERLGGLDKLHLTKEKWRVSDDTVMHLATGDALVKFGNKTVAEKLYEILAVEYVECMKDMDGRAPGPTTMQATGYLSTRHTHVLPFNSRGGGCGAAMRAMCIGLRYPKPEDLDDLIAVSVESGRLTHHNPTGYLGALASALFTSYAIQKKSIESWGRELMKNVLPKAKDYIRKGRDADDNLKAWSYFEDKWNEYLHERQITDGKSEPFFPQDFDVKARDQFYNKYSFSGWGGASGHDAPMIAYDALLGSKDWTDLCLRGMLHGGDNDSTGAIAGAWFGALYGFKGVPEIHYKDLEYRKRLEKLGKEIYKLASAKDTTPQGEEPIQAAKETPRVTAL